MCCLSTGTIFFARRCFHCLNVPRVFSRVFSLEKCHSGVGGSHCSYWSGPPSRGPAIQWLFSKQKFLIIPGGGWVGLGQGVTHFLFIMTLPRQVTSIQRRGLKSIYGWGCLQRLGGRHHPPPGRHGKACWGGVDPHRRWSLCRRSHNGSRNWHFPCQKIDAQKLRFCSRLCQVYPFHKEFG